MQIARIIAPIHSLGPGEGVGLWVQGCSKKCIGCMSEEMQYFDINKNIPIDFLASLLIQEAVRNNCNRLTISGGDPFEQAEELCKLLIEIRPHFSDILVYSGFTIEEIESSRLMHKCLEYVDVLVDGRYIDGENTGSSRLYGSNNQKVHLFNNDLADDYQEFEMGDHLLETFIHNNTVITVGIQER